MSEMRPRCPFYGFRWTPTVNPPVHYEIGGSECGLDVEVHKPCRMHAGRETVNYDACALGLQWKPLLANQLSFRPQGRHDRPSLEEWTAEVMRPR
jgi:hypothetical protein